MDELKRQVQQLQQRLEWYEPCDHNGSHYNSDGHSSGEDNEEITPFENPLYHSRSKAYSNNESLPHQRAPWNHGFQQDKLDAKVDFQSLKEECN